MARTNGKTQFEDQQIDAEHELPTGEGTDRDDEEQSPGSVAPGEHVSEIEKLRAERDALVDRLARMQAEFDNARKRAAKEQPEYREYAPMDPVKSPNPMVEDLHRALRS